MDIKDNWGGGYKMSTLINNEEKIRLLNISEDMKKFLTILNQYPAIERYWYIENSSYVVNIEQIKNDFGLMSHGEQILIKFFLSVFTGQQQSGFEFDLFEAVRVLDQHHRNLIISWIENPFYP